MKNLVIICPSVPIEKIYNSLFIYELTKEINVHYVNVNPITVRIDSPDDRAVMPYILIKNEDDLLKYISKFNNKDTLVNIEAPSDFRFNNIYSIVKEKKFITGTFMSCHDDIRVSTLAENVHSFSSAITKKLLPHSLFERIKSIYHHFSKKIEWEYQVTYSPDIVFAQGQHASRYFPNSLHVPCNYVDYEQWIRERPIQSNSGKKNICVFLDQAACSHPDNSILCDIAPFDKAIIDNYFEQMNNLFQTIENEFSLEVIIAAHPRSNYHGDEFNGRKIVYGKTLEFMRKAKMAVAHFSASCGYAAMFKIPLLLITCNLFKTKLKAYYPYIKGVSKFLGSQIIDAENLPKTLKSYCNLDKNKYREYLLQFSTWPQYENKLSAPDVANFIRNLMY